MKLQIWSTSLVLAGTLLLAACGAAPGAATAPTAAPTAAHGADHGMSMAGDDAPYDARFIDAMMQHHEGAIAMAKQAQSEATHPEIKTLADAIITAQQAENTQMQTWREAWYPGLASTGGMTESQMGGMSIDTDTSKPFDQRFIEAMIAHHQSAIDMAKEAQQQAEHPEIKELANAVITAQQAEIEQMKGWLAEWYGVQP